MLVFRFPKCHVRLAKQVLRDTGDMAESREPIADSVVVITGTVARIRQITPLGLQRSAGITQNQHWPIETERMMIGRIVTGVDNNCVVEHRAVALGNLLELGRHRRD